MTWISIIKKEIEGIVADTKDKIGATEIITVMTIGTMIMEKICQSQ